MSEGRIGVDFGGTALKAGLVSEGRVLRRESVPTPAAEGADATMEALAGLVKRLDARPAGLGLSIPGEVDADGRCVRLPNVPGFEGRPLAAELSGRLGCPVRVENDATAAALGEQRHGAGRRHASFLLLTLGTGVGGGLVLDGRLRRGARGFAGEVGHVLIDSGERAWPCGCGRRGCLESRAGSAGLLRAWAEARRAEGREPEPEASPALAAEAARAGEEAARRAWESWGRALGTALATLQAVLDLDAVVLTGGLAPSWELGERALREELSARAYAPALAAVPIELSELGGDAGLIGAAELLR